MSFEVWGRFCEQQQKRLTHKMCEQAPKRIDTTLRLSDVQLVFAPPTPHRHRPKLRQRRMAAEVRSAIPQLVQIIRPNLHHRSALLDVFRTVVRIAIGILHLMRQLQLNNCRLDGK